MIEIKYEKVIIPARTWKLKGKFIDEKEYYYPEKKGIKILKIIALDLDELPVEYLKQSNGYIPACWATTRDNEVTLRFYTPRGVEVMTEGHSYSPVFFHEWLRYIAKAKNRLDKIRAEMNKKEQKWYGEFEVRI
ncbi:MAG: hypothetical protein WCR45_02995 [Bacteroidaceae bacterium]|nr:hypothetical protein [Bacteroidaceae bacterium]